MSRMIRVADYIMKRIAAEGIGHIFYVPGGQCVYLTDAVRRCEELQGVSVHHEQAAAMAATGYARQNGNMGACLVTTGCAGTNTITGVLHAWQESVPCIFVSGQQNVSQTIGSSGLPLRQVGIQEADIVTLVSSITKYAVMVTDPATIGKELDKAIGLAREGRRGPVWLDIPLDVQNAMVDEDVLEHDELETKSTPVATDKDIEQVEEWLRGAQRPVILAGNGIRSSKAIEELHAFAEQYQIPVLFTRPSVDLMGYEHPLHYGVVSAAAANRYANFIIQNSDLVLSVGSRLSIETTGPDFDSFARAAKIIAVDIDAIEHQKKAVKIDLFVHSDAKRFFEKMLQKKATTTYTEWTEKCNHWKSIFGAYTDAEIADREQINVKYFLNKLSEVLPEQVTVISDAGFTGSTVPANCHVSKNGRMIHAYAQGEMGYALPAAVGVSYATDQLVVPIIGDGSFMMNLQELQTVTRSKGNIKIVLNNNNGYSGVRHGQKAHFRGKSIGTDPTNGIDFPDYRKVADAFNIPFYRIERYEELEDTIEQFIQQEGIAFLEVMTDPEQIEYHNALVKYGKRDFGFRPIEDQSPFLDRDVFFEEMIVEPMQTSYGEPV